jgi:beta-galactosidase GanA
MAVYPPGWMGITDNYKVCGNLDDPVFWQRSQEYVRRVVGRYYKSPALDSWIVWKEPARFISRNVHSMRGFRRWLSRVYKGDIKNLNAIYYNSYFNFDEVGVKSPSADDINVLKHPEMFPDNVKWFLDHPSFPEHLDWMRFSIDNLCGKIGEIVETLREIDTTHPVQVNPQGMNANLLNAGQSVWREAKKVDFLGCSNHPSWHSQRLGRSRMHQSIPYYNDMVRSATPDPGDYFWITEMQAGPTTMSGVIYYTPTYNDMTLWTWECVGSGASAVLYWLFNIRNSGDEAGEWSMLRQDGKPSDRLNAVTDIAGIVRRNQELFDSAKPSKPDLWLLCSETSWAAGDIEGRGEDVKSPRNKQLGSDALNAAYLMAADMNLQVGMVDEQKVINGELPDDAILLAPSVIAAADGLVPALGRFVEGGGTLIADNMFAFKDKYAYTLKPDQKAESDVLFGAVLTDIIPDDEDFSLYAADMSFPGWFLRLSFEPATAEVIGTFEDGSPAVIRNRYGKGCAIRIGTAFFQRYLPFPDRPHLNYLKSLLPKDCFAGTRLENPGSHLRLRVLESRGEEILILLNYDREPATARLKTEHGGTLRSLNGKSSFTVTGNGAAEIPMEKTSACIYLFSPEVK